MEKTAKKVIVRADRAGVFYGTLESRDGSEVKMSNCRRLWYWSGAASISQLAEEGSKDPSACKFTMPVSEIEIFGVIEIIPCSQEAISSIENIKAWKL